MTKAEFDKINDTCIEAKMKILDVLKSSGLELRDDGSGNVAFVHPDVGYTGFELND
jgi:hypothetical protein